jgi:hypothetical protein
MVAAFSSLDSEQLAKAAADNPALVSQMGPEHEGVDRCDELDPPVHPRPAVRRLHEGVRGHCGVREAGGWDAVGDALHGPARVDRAAPASTRRSSSDTATIPWS